MKSRTEIKVNVGGNGHETLYIFYSFERRCTTCGPPVNFSQPTGS